MVPAMLAALTTEDFGYRLLLLLHIVAVVVGYGVTFVIPFFTARLRRAQAVSRMEVQEATTILGGAIVAPALWVAGLFGIVLVAVGPWEFSDTWVSIAFVLWIAGAALALFVILPSERKALGLARRIANAQAGGETVAQYNLVKSRTSMLTSVNHVIFLLLVIDMIWKPWS
jgi:uncharacterized membrane protein